MTKTDETIAYEPRLKDRKSALSVLRKRGMVPGIVYGDKKEETLISVDNRDIFKHLRQGEFFSTVYSMKEEGVESKSSLRVLPRDVQMHPVKDVPVHIDFLRVTEKTTLRVSVPVHFINETVSPGLKSGGVLTIVRHEVDLVGKLGSMPSAIEVDLSPYQIGDAIKISAVTLPEGITATITNRDFTIANIALPKVQEATDVEVQEEESTTTPEE